jgi:hypothetical protein
LLSTEKNGDGNVLLQNHLGDFGLELLLNPPVTNASSTGMSTVAVSAPIALPGEGVVVSARQLAQVFSGLSINELSCARPIPDGSGKFVGNTGILLFITKEGDSRVKGGAMEFEFSGGKISRIAFQLATYRDFEQDLLERPEVGSCRIDPAFLAKLH